MFLNTEVHASVWPRDIRQLPQLLEGLPFKYSIRP
jgi:hypothetical protein